MPLYIDAEMITDETAVAEAVLAGMADRIDSALQLEEGEGWEPSEGSPETSFGEAVGIVIATAAAMVQEQERNDYAGFGELILNVQRLHAEPAVGYAKWTFNEAGDYLIPDGSEMTLTAPDGTPVAYATVGDVNVTAAIDATDVQMVAIEPGTIANGLTGVAIDWEALPFVVSVEMTTAPTGGTEEETRDQYLEKVVRKARRMKVVPIVTDDYADTALDHPSVGAAMAIRLLDEEVYPATPNSPGHVTVFARSLAGTALSPEDKAEIVASMMGEDRPLAVTVHAADPTYTDFTAGVAVVLDANADEDATLAAVHAAITNAYDPAVYDFDATAPGNWRAPRNETERSINAYDLSVIAASVAGVSRVAAASVNGGDLFVTLDGWAPLPNLTDLSVQAI